MNPRPIGARLAGIITVLAAAVACCGQNPMASGIQASQPALDPVVDKILTRLESREVHDLRAKVSWMLRYVVDTEEDATTKKGQLWYQQQEPSTNSWCASRRRSPTTGCTSWTSGTCSTGAGTSS